MSILAWMLLGLIAGVVAGKLVSHSREGVVTDIALGVVGAAAGGWLFKQFGQPGMTGLDLWSLFAAVVGAVVLLVFYHTVTGIVPRQS
jgi:uncharacterized membrane protein YeaQ/YmgE (transglycosylase-associated protein family)